MCRLFLSADDRAKPPDTGGVQDRSQQKIPADNNRSRDAQRLLIGGHILGLLQVRLEHIIEGYAVIAGSGIEPTCSGD